MLEPRLIVLAAEIVAETAVAVAGVPEAEGAAEAVVAAVAAEVVAADVTAEAAEAGTNPILRNSEQIQRQ